MDCELSEKQFQLRYTDKETGLLHESPANFYRAEINPVAIDLKHYEEQILKNIETAMLETGCKTGIVDNIGYLCNFTDKGVDAGVVHDESLGPQVQVRMVPADYRAHAQTLSLQPHHAERSGSKKLYYYFDSVMAIGQSAKDENICYVKQLKICSGENEYGFRNVQLYTITHDNGWVHFEFVDFGDENDHLRDRTDEDRQVESENIANIKSEEKSVCQIAGILSISKSKVGRILKELPLVPSREDARDGRDSKATPSSPVKPGSQ